MRAHPRQLSPRAALAAFAAGLCILLGGACLLRPSTAVASHSQFAMIEDDSRMALDPTFTLSQMRVLGAQVVRQFVFWGLVAPDPFSSRRPRFDASDPRAYPADRWVGLDTEVRTAQRDGLRIDLLVTGGAPAWARAPGGPANDLSWEPSPREYGLFVRALARRYSGHFSPSGHGAPLPRVSIWEIWNEPNFGEDLSPEAVDGSRIPVAPVRYRELLGAAWTALQRTGHGHDTIEFGQLAARGASALGHPGALDGLPGVFGQTKPLIFIRDLYCVDRRLHPLRGSAAAALRCPLTARGSRAFRARNPALFRASGFGIHPYPQGLPPTREASPDPDFAAFSEIPRLERTLDRINRVYGSNRRLPIFNNEYGYITNPPNRFHHFVSPAVAGYYLNWTEYLSWRDPRIATTMQYLLYDPNPLDAPEYGGFASGLILFDGTVKASYNDYRMPLFLPSTSTRAGQALEVWGAARPAPFARDDTGAPQVVQIQFAPAGSSSFNTVAAVVDQDPHGYYDLRVRFPGSGRVRAAWSYPPRDQSTVGYLDPLARTHGETVYSRTVTISVH